MNEFIPAGDMMKQFLAEHPDACYSSVWNQSVILDKFSIALADYRYHHHLSQKELADLLQIGQSMVSQYENGTRNISIKTLCDHCEKLHLIPQLTFAEPASSTAFTSAEDHLLPVDEQTSYQYA